MAVPTHSKVWTLQHKPTTAINFSNGPDATFSLKTVEIPAQIPEDSLLVKTVLLSNDPAQRGWIQKGMDPKRLYVSPVQEGEVMHSRAVARVLKVGGSGGTYKEGDLVTASTGWSEYAVVKKSTSLPIKPLPGVSPSVFLGPFGVSGLTAYWGVVDVLNLQRDETIVVSGAAGAVGNVVVQLAKKLFGAKVVAIVGTAQKAEYVKKIGADVAVNYKSPTFEEDLAKATPDYAETYFDNVGGYISSLVIKRLKRHGRFAACGAISAYNDPSKNVLGNFTEVISNRLQVKGFIVIDYLHRPEGIKALIEAYEAGQLVLAEGETIVEVKGLEEVPKVWHRLFEGKNQGKLVTQLP